MCPTDLLPHRSLDTECDDDGLGIYGVFELFRAIHMHLISLVTGSTGRGCLVPIPGGRCYRENREKLQGKIQEKHMNNTHDPVARVLVDMLTHVYCSSTLMIRSPPGPRLEGADSPFEQQRNR